MTKAEEKALEVYPVLEVCSHANGPYDTFSKLDVNKERRSCYQQGYEQAEKDINKELIDKMTEIREKQEKAMLSDMNYDIHFEPSAGFDIGSAVVYHNDKVVDELTIKDLELLHIFLYAVKNNKQGVFTFTRLSDEQYNEVLRRFKETKK